jgi:hypothetical protein
MNLIKQYDVQNPTPDIYAHRCVQEDNGIINLVVRAKSALMINSEQTKQVAKKALSITPGYDQRGMEMWGGAYLVDDRTGEMLKQQPMLKTGDTLPAYMLYERKFRLNPTL